MIMCVLVSSATTMSCAGLLGRDAVDVALHFSATQKSELDPGSNHRIGPVAVS